MSERPPRVSVLCPVYNGEAHLREAIDSIVQQTFGDWELVLLDDGSSDRSLEICREAEQSDRRVRLHSAGANRGLGVSMAQLAELAAGDLLAVQEQDDVSLTTRLADQVALLDQRPEVGLVSGIAAWCRSDGTVFHHFPGLLTRGTQYPQDLGEMVRFLMIEQCKVVNAGCMFRRSVLETDHPDMPAVRFDARARMSVDWQFFVRLAHHWRIWALHQVLVRVRRGADHDSLTRRKELQFAEARRCLRILFQDYRGRSGSPIDRRLYRQAMASQLHLEARHWSGLRGLGLLFRSLLWHPTRRATWSSLLQFGHRAVRKMAPA